MWPRTHSWKLWAIALGWIGSALLSPTTLWAQRPDPVEELRLALPIRLSDAEPTQASTDFRRAILQKKVDALRDIGELRRALALDEWKEDPNRVISVKFREIDAEMRQQVGKRLTDALRAVIKSGDATARIAVANMIAEMGPTIRSINPGEKTGFARVLTPEVIQLTQDKDLGVRQEALRALGSMYPKATDAVPVFAKVLADDSPGPRRLAADGLGQLIRVVSHLRKRATTTAGVEAYRPDVFQTVLEVVKVLKVGLKDPDPQVRTLTLQVLQIAGQTVSDLVSDPIPKKEFPPEGRPLTEEETTRIVGFHTDVQLELKGIQALTDALREYSNELAAALEDPDINVRLAASLALENMGSVRVRLKRYVNSVPPAGDKGDLGNRETLQKNDALQDFIKNHLGAMTKLLSDPDVRLRRSAIDFLDLIEESATPALPLLAESLLDPDRFVRWAAARALGNIAPEKAAIAVPNLGKLLCDSDLNVRMAAALTLETMGPLAKEAAPQLAAATAVGDVEGRIAAMYALQRLDADSAKLATLQLAEALSHPDPRTRRVAAQTLGVIGPGARAAVPALRRALGDDDQDVRINASDAILSIQR